MLTDIEIEELITSSKKIITRVPAKGYKQGGGNLRCDLHLENIDTKEEIFRIFIRQNSEFIENYSIGLRYKSDGKELGTITLVRYNGPHGETSKHEDGHYNKPHIHRITAKELASGSTMPQESYRKITNRYGTLEQAIVVFFKDIGVTNYLKYFPGINQLDIFNEH